MADWAQQEAAWEGEGLLAHLTDTEIWVDQEAEEEVSVEMGSVVMTRMVMAEGEGTACLSMRDLCSIREATRVLDRHQLNALNLVRQKDSHTYAMPSILLIILFKHSSLLHRVKY
jgi:hypothetical protein